MSAPQSFGRVPAFSGLRSPLETVAGGAMSNRIPLSQYLRVVTLTSEYDVTDAPVGAAINNFWRSPNGPLFQFQSDSYIYGVNLASSCYNNQDGRVCAIVAFDSPMVLRMLPGSQDILLSQVYYSDLNSGDFHGCLTSGYGCDPMLPLFVSAGRSIGIHGSMETIVGNTAIASDAQIFYIPVPK